MLSVFLLSLCALEPVWTESIKRWRATEVSIFIFLFSFPVRLLLVGCIPLLKATAPVKWHSPLWTLVPLPSSAPNHPEIATALYCYTHWGIAPCLLFSLNSNHIFVNTSFIKLFSTHHSKNLSGALISWSSLYMTSKKKKKMQHNLHHFHLLPSAYQAQEINSTAVQKELLAPTTSLCENYSSIFFFNFTRIEVCK